MRSNEEIMEIIEKLTNEKGLSISELARKVDIAKSSMSRYFNRTRGFPLNRVDDFARVLGVSSEYILGFEDNRRQLISIYEKLEPDRQKIVYQTAEEQLKEQNKNIVQFPIEKQIDIVLSAGDNGEWLEGLDAGTVTLYTEPPKHDFIAKVNGRSMEPTFEDGEILFVESAHEARNGQFVVARVNGTGYVKKYLEVDGKPKLLSLNKEYSDVELNEHDRFEIIGVVNL